LTLPARSERMTALLAASQLRRKRRMQELQGAQEEANPGTTVVRLDLRRKEGQSNAMDRVAVAA
jgi:protein ImuA